MVFSFRSYQQLLSLCLGPMKKGFVSRADTAPFQGPQLASCVSTEKHGRRWMCQTGDPRTQSKTSTDVNLDCAFLSFDYFTKFVGNPLFYAVPWLWKVNSIKFELLVTRPAQRCAKLVRHESMTRAGAPCRDRSELWRRRASAAKAPSPNFREVHKTEYEVTAKS